MEHRREYDLMYETLFHLTEIVSASGPFATNSMKRAVVEVLIQARHQVIDNRDKVRRDIDGNRHKSPDFANQMESQWLVKLSGVSYLDLHNEYYILAEFMERMGALINKCILD